MKPKASALAFVALTALIGLFTLHAAACSGGASNTTKISGGAGAAGSTTGSAGSTPGAAGSTTMGSAGALGTAGSSGVAGAAAGSVGSAGAVGTPGFGGSEGTAGVPGMAGAGGGAAGSDGGAGAAPTVDGSADAAKPHSVFPATTIVKMMVVGSSNEIGTCWRAFLWQELRMNGIMNFDFVGQQNGGPDCGVGMFDSDLQAMSGIIITDIPASTYAAWFKANLPDVVLMHFGGADLLSGKPIAGVMKAYSTFLEQARIANPKIILLIAQHTPEGKDTVLELNADIATWAPQNSTAASPVVAVDLYTGILPSDESDGVHLNAVGSQKVADRWYAALKPFFKP
jgi:hypothetical protein